MIWIFLFISVAICEINKDENNSHLPKQKSEALPFTDIHIHIHKKKNSFGNEFAGKPKKGSKYKNVIVDKYCKCGIKPSMAKRESQIPRQSLKCTMFCNKDSDFYDRGKCSDCEKGDIYGKCTTYCDRDSDFYDRRRCRECKKGFGFCDVNPCKITECSGVGKGLQWAALPYFPVPEDELRSPANKQGITPRVTRGNEVRAGEWPWIASLSLSGGSLFKWVYPGDSGPPLNPSGNYSGLKNCFAGGTDNQIRVYGDGSDGRNAGCPPCSGTIIADKWILTAAHCVMPPKLSWTVGSARTEYCKPLDLNGRVRRCCKKYFESKPWKIKCGRGKAKDWDFRKKWTERMAVVINEHQLRYDLRVGGNDKYYVNIDGFRAEARPSTKDTWDEKLKRQVYRVEKIITRPKFGNVEGYDDSESKYADIALLRLEKSIDGWQQKTICLPLNLPAGKWVNKIADVYGWGKSEEIEGNANYIANKASYCLQEGKVKTMSHKECKSKWPGIKKMKKWVFCALGEKKGNGWIDTCTGDSGGPISRELTLTGGKGRRHYQLGLTHAGPTDCGKREVPGRYALMSRSNVLWIFKTMNNNGGATVCERKPRKKKKPKK